MLWATHKYKRLKGSPQKAKAWLTEVINRDPFSFRTGRRYTAMVDQ